MVLDERDFEGLIRPLETDTTCLHPFIAEPGREPGITAIGCVVADIIIPLGKDSPFLPPSGSQLVWQGDKACKIQNKTTIESYLETLPDNLRKQVRITYGGLAFAASRILHQLSARVKFIGVIGNDEYGNKLLSLMKKEGMDTSGVKVEENASTPVNLIFSNLDTGDTAFNPAPGDTRISFSLDDIRKTGLAGSSLLLGGVTLFPRLMENIFDVIEEARKSSMKIVWDTVVDIEGLEKKAYLSGVHKTIDVLTPGMAEAKMITEKDNPEDIMHSLEQSCPAVFLKNGQSGCEVIVQQESIFGEAKRFHIPAVLGVNVKDGTGSGDSFSGYMAYAIATGLSAVEAAIGASVCGAISVEQLGGGTLGKNPHVSFLQKLTQLKLEMLLQHQDKSIRQAGIKKIKKNFPLVYNRFRKLIHSDVHLKKSDIAAISRAVGELVLKNAGEQAP